MRCNMIAPKIIFDRPQDHWSLITAARDEDFEGQFFDRKALPLAGVYKISGDFGASHSWGRLCT